MRGYLIFNPREFRSAEEILAHLQLVLPTWRPTSSPPPLHADFKILRAVSNIPARGRVEDQLQILLKNESDQTIRSFRLELAMPRGAFDNPDNMRRLYERHQSTDSIDLFRFTSENLNSPPLYPGDRRELTRMNYSVRELPVSAHTAVATLYVEGFNKQEYRINLGPEPGQAG